MLSIANAFCSFTSVAAFPPGTGEDICKKVLETMEEWGVKPEHVIGMSFDTTASNTGGKSGACVKIEATLGEQSYII